MLELSLVAENIILWEDRVNWFFWESMSVVIENVQWLLCLWDLLTLDFISPGFIRFTSTWLHWLGKADQVRNVGGFEYKYSPFSRGVKMAFSARCFHAACCDCCSYKSSQTSWQNTKFAKYDWFSEGSAWINKGLKKVKIVGIWELGQYLFVWNFIILPGVPESVKIQSLCLRTHVISVFRCFQF